MKKIIAALLAVSMISVLASCSNSEKTADVAEETTAVQTEEVSETTAAEEETEEETEEGFDKSKLVYDFSGLDSEEWINILSSEKYHVLFKYVYMGKDMYQDLYYNNGAMIITTEFMDTSYSMLYKDKTEYTLSGDIYFKIENDEDLGSGNMFEAFGYVMSGETELDGKTYKYDEYYQTTSDSFTQILMTDDNKVYAFVSGEQVMYIEKIDADFDPSEKIALPEGAKEVSAEEFNTSMMNQIENSSESVIDTEESEEAEPENTEE